jgi:hypothetical protein
MLCFGGRGCSAPTDRQLIRAPLRSCSRLDLRLPHALSSAADVHMEAGGRRRCSHSTLLSGLPLLPSP